MSAFVCLRLCLFRCFTLRYKCVLLAVDAVCMLYFVVAARASCCGSRLLFDARGSDPDLTIHQSESARICACVLVPEPCVCVLCATHVRA